MSDTNMQLNITPSPRVLRMLGQIDFQPWQCLAELIDNGIDALMHQHEIVNSRRIVVTPPKSSALNTGNAVLTVTDNGPGMTIDQLAMAVRAGYSGNDPVEKLGLFGMGFNISTARLGKRTEVWTTMRDDADWVGVEIDFDNLERLRAFEAPVKRRPKTNDELADGAHGTKIEISKLDSSRIAPLIHGAGKALTKRRLGKIYGHVMSAHNITLIYDGDIVKPRRFCTWDKRREVDTSDFGRVPAIISIDEEFEPRKFCHTCWTWLLTDELSCPSCGNDNNIVNRPRRIKGWIGIQRYFDKTDFGIDLIRNGRVIEELDKSLFDWIDGDGKHQCEYPIDAVHWGGRIVGELEIDFVRVSHQKDAFDKLDPEWQKVRETIRGKAPLRPKIATSLNFDRNGSPLARLFAAYRSGYAGVKCLVPGNASGVGKNDEELKSWVDKFHESDPEYITDAKWYELVLQAEVAKNKPTNKGNSGQFPIKKPTPAPTVGGNNNQPTEIVDSPKFQRDVSLSKEYKLTELPSEPMIEVSALRLTSGKLERAFKVSFASYKFSLEYDPFALEFVDTLLTPTDVLLRELPHYFLTMSGESPKNFSHVYVESLLRSKYFPSTQTSAPTSALEAASVLLSFRQAVIESFANFKPLKRDSLPIDDIENLRKRFVTQRSTTDGFEEALNDGSIIQYCSDEFLQKTVAIWPQLIFDGCVLSQSYSTVDSHQQAYTVQDTSIALSDICWLANDACSIVDKDIIWRLRFARSIASLNLFQLWRQVDA